MRPGRPKVCRCTKKKHFPLLLLKSWPRRLLGPPKTKNKEVNTQRALRVLPRGPTPSDPQKKENGRQYSNFLGDANVRAASTRSLQQTGRKEKDKCMHHVFSKGGIVSFTIVWNKRMARAVGPHRHRRRRGRRFQTSGRAQSAAGCDIHDRTWRDSACTALCATMIP